MMDIFIQNRYRTWYFKIIDRAISENKKRNNNQIYERHHIIPVLLGGTNTKTNLVLLTPKEHFIAHLLLVRITVGNDYYKMVYAARFMARRYNSGRKYEWFKKSFVESERKSKTIESIKKQSNTMKKQCASGKINNRTGCYITASHKEAISRANTGKIIPIKSRSSLEGYTLRYGEQEGLRKYQEDSKRKAITLDFFIQRYGEKIGREKFQERKDHYSKMMIGKPGTPHSEETKLKLREIQLAHPKIPCSVCGKMCKPSMIARWHETNCKYR